MSSSPRLLTRLIIAFVAAWVLPAQAQTQSTVLTNGTLVIVPAYGEVRHVNDEARITLMIEEQDKDKAVAASRVNQKMKQGTELVRRQDPQAILKTRGYYTYPVYPETQDRQTGKARQPTGWRVGQYLDVTTSNLGSLPNTVAKAQQQLALNAISFGLAPATTKKLEDRRIEATYQNLTERIAVIARAMGRNVSEAVLDTVDFEGSGAYVQQQDMQASKAMTRSAMAMEAVPVEEPSFEPGETTLQMRVVGKVRFK